MASMVYIFQGKRNSGTGGEMVHEVVTEKFTVEVSNSGYLEALNFSEVYGPSEPRKFRLWNLTIDQLVEEGTLIEKGDFVAELDRSEFYDILEENRLELDQYKAQFEQVQFDTSLNLRIERDDIKNLEYTVQEKELALDSIQLKKARYE